MKLIYRIFPIFINIVLSVVIVRFIVSKYTLSVFGIWGVILSYRMLISILLLNTDNYILMDGLRKGKNTLSGSEILGINTIYLVVEWFAIFFVGVFYNIELYTILLLFSIGALERLYINNSRNLVILDKGKYIPFIEMMSNFIYVYILYVNENISLYGVVFSFFCSQLVKGFISYLILWPNISIAFIPVFNISLMKSIFISSGGGVLQLIRVRGITSLSVILFGAIISSESAALLRMLQRCPQIICRAMDTFTSMYKNRITNELDSKNFYYIKFCIFLVIAISFFSIINLAVSEIVFDIEIPDSFYSLSILVSLSFSLLQARKLTKILFDYRGEYNAIWYVSLPAVIVQVIFMMGVSFLLSDIIGFTIAWVLISVIDAIFLFFYVKKFLYVESNMCK